MMYARLAHNNEHGSLLSHGKGDAMNSGVSGERSEIKRDRLHLRLDATSLHKIEQAAHYLNKTPSEFVVLEAVAAANKVIDAHRHLLTLSEADWDRFCEALTQAPEPSRKLVEAAQRYAKRGGRVVG
jgi:uncharacterized protein (DUF1778 family)